MHIHDVFIENGDDSVVMKPGWGLQRPAGCTRDILVENVTIFRGMGANIGGLGSGCVVGLILLLQPPRRRRGLSCSLIEQLRRNVLRRSI